MCGNRTDASINYEKSLFDFLPYKEELWNKYLNNENTNDKIIEECENMKQLFDIKIKNILDFYNLIKIDENDEIVSENKKQINKKKRERRPNY